jgi:hypothetical protein
MMLYWGPHRHGASESTKRSALRRFSTAFSTSAFSFAIIRGNFATASIRYARCFGKETQVSRVRQHPSHASRGFPIASVC